MYLNHNQNLYKLFIEIFFYFEHVISNIYYKNNSIIMEHLITIEELQDILEQAKLDYIKIYDRNNKAAATRLRKTLSDVSKQCKLARKQVMEHKKSIKK